MDIGHFTRRMYIAPDERLKQKTAVREESGRSWSFLDLHEKSNTYANQLLKIGVKKGDSVGILFSNCLEYFALYFAIGKVGAIAVRINFRLTANELEYILNDSKTKVLCFHNEFSEKINPIHEKICTERFICLSNNGKIPSWADDWNVLSNGSTEEVDNVPISINDPVMLMYTSGTTGRPKGALWTHNTTFWFSIIQIMQWGFTGNEIAMTTGPLYHVGAIEDLALPVLLMGGTVIITKSRGFEIERVLKVIEKEKVTDCFLFPFMIYDMLNLPNLSYYQLAYLKTIYTGGDPLMPWAIEKIYRHYPQVGIVQVYGLTEGQPIATSLNSKHSIKKSKTVGTPLPLTEVRVMKEDGSEALPGEVGEIWIKSPGVSEGYWEKPEATAESFCNGWCKTGDLGKFDEDGFLSVAGRKKDMIRSGGENIYAAEIEDVLYRHEAVKDVAVIGIPDKKYIEAVCAVIVLKGDSKILEEELIQYSKQFLASYKTPKKVIFVDDIPRTPSGKVKKFVLRDMYSNCKQEEDFYGV
ncbi:AMP-binding protein [uncultured Rummeliibacillus sp.]|uniref:AMP-binding protein n=1 Tax=uncultured Rummeliibacillus sp. TaxID=762292 RepID=UPI002625E13B|nr:AMP-binding protein [uncultured Rummeliibacillus sp.]